MLYSYQLFLSDSSQLSEDRAPPGPSLDETIIMTFLTGEMCLRGVRHHTKLIAVVTRYYTELANMGVLFPGSKSLCSRAIEGLRTRVVYHYFHSL